jgi:hypothetical protein
MITLGLLQAKSSLNVIESCIESPMAPDQRYRAREPLLRKKLLIADEPGI